LADSGTETLVALSRLHAVARAARDGPNVRNLILTNIKEYFPPVVRALFMLARERREGHRTPIDRAAGEHSFQDLLNDRPALRSRALTARHPETPSAFVRRRPADLRRGRERARPRSLRSSLR